MSGCTMTLTLDDVRNTVRNKRFRVARKAGYEVLEVDEFVDEVGKASPSCARITRILRSRSRL